MCSFQGVFANLPGVSVDNFEGVNKDSDQFFLSHCHTGNNTLFLYVFEKKEGKKSKLGFLNTN